MSILVALTISIGVLSVVATWLFLGPLAALNMQIWQAFLGWASFYHCGGKTDGLKKTAICMSFGALIGMLAVMLAGQLGALGPLAAPVAVGLGAAVIVQTSQISLLSTIPACVYGFGAVAGLILLKGLAPLDAILPTIGSVVIGALFGWVSEWAGGKMAKS
jgi:hypothetical protein